MVAAGDSQAVSTLSTNLSSDQDSALYAIHSALAAGDRVLTLVGPAGSGKTTLMRALINDVEASGRSAKLICPTGKAASVLASKTGRDACTIHAALYGSHNDDGEELTFGDPGPPCGDGDLLVCDEASMVGSEIHSDIMEWLPPRAQLLYVGDREQLEPVNDTWGPDFDFPTAVLTEVHRQAAGNPIIRLATAIRNQQPFAGWDGDRCVRIESGDPCRWLLERLIGGVDATLVTFTNLMRQSINSRVRRLLNHDGDPCRGEPLVVLKNNYDIGRMNGEVLTVASMHAVKKPTSEHRIAKVVFESGEIAMVNLDLMGRPVREFVHWCESLRRRKKQTKDFLHVDFGYCLTVHKSQGSEWHSVGFVSCPTTRNMRDHEFRRRLGYTAVTRAAEHLTIFRTGRTL